MKKTLDIKEKIIAVTIDLIQASNGNVKEITTRSIAEKANVGVGLINYHFQTKDNLIEICVQQIIGSVISQFKPELNTSLNPNDRLLYVVKQVADFLMDNKAVSRISILGDYTNPQVLDNTMKTVKGFYASLGQYNISDRDKNILLFAVTSILQSSFLRADMSRELFGYDMHNKPERDAFIDFIVKRLLNNTD